jgi:hypothetical protein
MYILSENYVEAMHDRKRAVILAYIQSQKGQWVYSYDMPNTAQLGGMKGIVVYDGEASIGDGQLLGSQGIVLDRGPYLISIDGLLQTISPEATNILASYARSSEITTVSATFNNSTSHFSEILTNDSFLTKTLWIRLGFIGINYLDFLDLYKGTIYEQTLTEQECRITAESI